VGGVESDHGKNTGKGKLLACKDRNIGLFWFRGLERCNGWEMFNPIFQELVWGRGSKGEIFQGIKKR